MTEKLKASDAFGQRVQTPLDIDGAEWHALSEEEVLRRLATSLDGLSSEEAELRQQRFGRNILPVHPPPTLLEIILHQFKSPLIYVLLAAGVVSILLEDVKDAVFIFAVVLLNASLGAFQEWRAEKSAAALQSLLRVYVRVRRNGAERLMDAEELTPGDIVLLESGNRAPADIRLLHTHNMTVDESLLTGESLAVPKRAGALERDLPLSERVNLVYAGSTVITGRGVGVVFATGVRTTVGEIAAAATTADTAKPPLVIRMERFARDVSFAVLGASALLALIAVSRGIPYNEVFFLAVALAVSAIPEGLPVALTVALSIATHRMAKRNVIVRKLTAVEGLGSCTYIASDKTGTLTVNKQTVRKLIFPEGLTLQVTGEGYNGQGEVLMENGAPLDEFTEARVEALVRIGILCNEGHLVYDRGTWEYHGDAVDIALLALAYKIGVDPTKAREAAQIVAEVPFESDRRYAATAYRWNGAGRIAVKGALEVMLPYCTHMHTARGVETIVAAPIEQAAMAMAANGYRVIALAETAPGVGDEDVALDDNMLPPLTLVGLVGLIDPLRPEAKPAVQKCMEAGIRVAMITGDHPATALAIARELGIASNAEEIVTGKMLAEVGPADTPAFIETVQRARVFARVTPMQKLAIVEALIRLGHFVAVTGDGVNDAPALRAANIGVAMGSGSDVAKDVASIIVTDDNFASIEAGVEEGRFAYDNVRKVTYLLISTGFAEVVLFTLAVFSGLPLPLFAVQLLWLNLVTNGIQDVALAFEAGEPGAMRRPPRKPTEGIFNPLMVQQTLVSGLTIGLIAFGAWFWLLRAGYDEFTARNLLLLLMVLFENVHVFNCRSEYTSAFRVPLRNNRILTIGVVVAFCIHLLSMHIPFMQELLRIAPVNLQEFGLMLALALSVLAAMEIFKWVRSRSPRDAFAASEAK